MNEWASKLLSVFPEKNKVDFQKYISEVKIENAQFMSVQRSVGDSSETRPTYDQLSEETISDEANKNLVVLKSIESILNDRMQAYSQVLSIVGRSRYCFEGFQSVDGTLRQALDSLFVFVEQESQQARQQHILGEVRKSISEMKNDAQRRVQDYQKQLSNAEKDVSSAEKRLQKCNEQIEKLIDQKTKMIELSDTDSNSASRIPRYVSPSLRTVKEIEDSLAKCDRDLREDARLLLKAIEARDQIQSASRKAFQKLDYDCKTIVANCLKKIVARERESAQARLAVLEKLQCNVDNIDIENDIADFIVSNRSDDSELLLSSQALSIMSDLNKHSKTADVDLKVGPITMQSKIPNVVPRVKTDSLDSTPSQLALSQDIESRLSIVFNAKYSISQALRDSQGVIGDLASDDSESMLSLSSESVGTKSNVTTASSSLDILNKRPEGVSMASLLKYCKQQAVDHREGISNVKAGDGEVERAVDWLASLMVSFQGRDAFTAVLNQFRSRKVELEFGFSSLGCVLWAALNACQSSNDVHNAKVIMMLSQTFFRSKKSLSIDNTHLSSPSNDLKDLSVSTTAAEPKKNDDDDDEDEDEDEDEVDQVQTERGAHHRIYVKELLVEHSLWQDGNFWEQALYECAMEQLQTIPYEIPWFEMDKDRRNLTVQRVHSVIFSQVMAITHSMIELAVDVQSIREFVYRMCVIHQLSESQRQHLLSHLHKTSQ